MPSDTGGGGLLVAKRDRLARDVVVSAMVERLAAPAAARVLTADGAGNGDGPEAQLVPGIIRLFAPFERALIRARTKTAWRRSAPLASAQAKCPAAAG